jgi:hypothetical protein
VMNFYWLLFTPSSSGRFLRSLKNLKQLETAEQLDEFVLLFIALSGTNLSDQIDKKIWKWTPYGKFSVASSWQHDLLSSSCYLESSF